MQTLSFVAACEHIVSAAYEKNAKFQLYFGAPRDLPHYNGEVKALCKGSGRFTVLNK